MTPAETAYRAFIAGIDCTVAGSDAHGNLAWHVACSAEANATDMQREGTAPKTDCGFYGAALTTAEMCLDCWRDYYPQLMA